MPPKFIAATRMATRAGNKDAHPGRPDMPAPRRTHAEVEQARDEAAAIEAEAVVRQDKAIEKLAAIEDEQLRQDEEREQERRKDRTAGKKI